MEFTGSSIKAAIAAFDGLYFVLPGLEIGPYSSVLSFFILYYLRGRDNYLSY